MTKHNSGRFAYMLVALVAILAVGGMIAYRWTRPRFVPPAVPVPNGYDDLLRAAEMLAPRTGWYPEMDEQELATVVEHNRSALAVAREGLEKDCLATLDWSADETWIGNVLLPRVQKLRELARAFAAEALQSHRDKNSQNSIRCGFDCLRLGQAIAHGALTVEWMVGKAVYAMGLHILRDEIENLSRSDCETLLHELLSMETTFETPSEIVKRDSMFYHATHNALESFLIRSVQLGQLKQTQKQLEGITRSYSTLRDILLTHLAIRLFQLDENRLPRSLDELVPDYLPAVPQDPFATGPLVYRPKVDGYQLYGVGANRQDDGGIEQDGSGKVDILLEPSKASLVESNEHE